MSVFSASSDKKIVSIIFLNLFLSKHLLEQNNYSLAYSISHIAQLIEARPLAPLKGDPQIKHLLLDSRNLTFPEHSLFFARAGNRNNGHDFIADLYEGGLRNFIITQEIDPTPFPEANFLKVDHGLLALQKIAAHHRSNFSLPVIGITGSNGKTIIKEWLFQLLQTDHSIVRSPKSYNSQIGVPLSVWKIEAEHTLGIFEAGISQKQEMALLAPIIQCDIGLFTNIGEAHREGFASEEEKISEKIQLFKSAHTLVYSVDHPSVNRLLSAQKEKKHFRWSRTGLEAELQITALDRQHNRTILTGTFAGKEQHISIPFSDEASIENAIHCWAMLLLLGNTPAVIAEKMNLLEAVGMRLELKPGINDCLLVNDSYNTDLNALAIALNFLEQQGSGKNQHLIISDILQSGQQSKDLYAKVAQLLAEKNIKRLTGIGPEIRLLKEQLPPSINSHFFADTDQFLNQLRNEDFQNEIILIKGARQFAFERIANRLSRQVHQTVLEINLSAVIHNLNVYSSYLKADTKIMAMVKASAYGSGSHEIARMLEYQKVDYFAVAYSDEGVDLRKAGIKTPILVLNPEENTIEALIRYRLDPEVYSLESLERLIRHLPDDASVVNIHLKLDTGMHRLGFEAPDIEPMLQRLKSHPQLHVRSIFSHLAASEAPMHDDFSERQIQLFQQLADQIAEGLAYQPWRHILNSSGISRFPQHQMDMVRLGIGMYGIDSSGLIQEKLETVHTLKSSISQIKTVAANESIGYNRSGKAHQKMRIGTIGIGYADGLLRAAGNGNYSVMIRGQKAPIVGNVCMDMCMIDLSDLPEVELGEEVILFGTAMPVQELAKSLGTIPYEVFTNISSRVKRVYFQE